ARLRVASVAGRVALAVGAQGTRGYQRLSRAAPPGQASTQRPADGRRACAHPADGERRLLRALVGGRLLLLAAYPALLHIGAVALLVGRREPALVVPRHRRRRRPQALAEQPRA